ncbi:unnamed protein product [Vitrella brassicaformis CCMP3155]|uniref:TLDc domain-containing protein n=1 Tax=Vitrella brassicaformis (strain CCMP3155) TaxID=1169540 RepID=A0A0G4EQZ1_VITBC|nr:unnamed protein product [Vitrella brassicaformis CCMP3155]|eukprot:CEL99675.1 unnamed protein product [Vitrella brassicaformis CCMP3155]
MYDLLRPDVVRAPPPLQDGSSLVVTLKDAMRLRQWIETDDIQVREFRLLYRASRDGWKYDDCVARINGQARLVFLVRCKEEIVGAFTSERFELPSDPSSYLVQWGCCDMFKLRGSAARPFTGKLTIKGDERRIAIAGTEGRVSLAVDPQKYGKLCFCAGRLWLWRWHDYPLINPCRMLCQRHPYQQCDSDGLMIDPADESRTAYAIFRPGRDTEGVPSSPTMWRQHARTDTWGFPNIARYMMGGAWLGSCKDDTTDQGEPVRAVMPGGGPYFYCSEIEVLTVL